MDREVGFPRGQRRGQRLPMSQTSRMETLTAAATAIEESTNPGTESVSKGAVRRSTRVRPLAAAAFTSVNNMVVQTTTKTKKVTKKVTKKITKSVTITHRGVPVEGCPQGTSTAIVPYGPRDVVAVEDFQVTLDRLANDGFDFSKLEAGLILAGQNATTSHHNWTALVGWLEQHAEEWLRPLLAKSFPGGFADLQDKSAADLITIFTNRFVYPVYRQMQDTDESNTTVASCKERYLANQAFMKEYELTKAEAFVIDLEDSIARECNDFKCKKFPIQQLDKHLPDICKENGWEWDPEDPKNSRANLILPYKHPKQLLHFETYQAILKIYNGNRNGYQLQSSQYEMAYRSDPYFRCLVVVECDKKLNAKRESSKSNKHFHFTNRNNKDYARKTWKRNSGNDFYPSDARLSEDDVDECIDTVETLYWDQKGPVGSILKNPGCLDKQERSLFLPGVVELQKVVVRTVGRKRTVTQRDEELDEVGNDIQVGDDDYDSSDEVHAGIVAAKSKKLAKDVAIANKNMAPFDHESLMSIFVNRNMENVVHEKKYHRLVPSAKLKYIKTDAYSVEVSDVAMNLACLTMADIMNKVGLPLDLLLYCGPLQRLLMELHRVPLVPNNHPTSVEVIICNTPKERAKVKKENMEKGHCVVLGASVILVIENALSQDFLEADLLMSNESQWDRDASSSAQSAVRAYIDMSHDPEDIPQEARVNIHDGRGNVIPMEERFPYFTLGVDSVTLAFPAEPNEKARISITREFENWIAALANDYKQLICVQQTHSHLGKTADLYMSRFNHEWHKLLGSDKLTNSREIKNKLQDELTAFLKDPTYRPETPLGVVLGVHREEEAKRLEALYMDLYANDKASGKAFVKLEDRENVADLPATEAEPFVFLNKAARDEAGTEPQYHPIPPSIVNSGLDKVWNAQFSHHYDNASNQNSNPDTQGLVIAGTDSHLPTVRMMPVLTFARAFAGQNADATIEHGANGGGSSGENRQAYTRITTHTNSAHFQAAGVQANLVHWSKLKESEHGSKPAPLKLHDALPTTFIKKWLPDYLDEEKRAAIQLYVDNRGLSTKRGTLPGGIELGWYNYQTENCQKKIANAKRRFNKGDLTGVYIKKKAGKGPKRPRLDWHYLMTSDQKKESIAGFKKRMQAAQEANATNSYFAIDHDKFADAVTPPREHNIDSKRYEAMHDKIIDMQDLFEVELQAGEISAEAMPEGNICGISKSVPTFRIGLSCHRIAMNRSTAELCVKNRKRLFMVHKSRGTDGTTKGHSTDKAKGKGRKKRKKGVKESVADAADDDSTESPTCQDSQGQSNVGDLQPLFFHPENNLPPPIGVIVHKEALRDHLLTSARSSDIIHKESKAATLQTRLYKQTKPERLVIWMVFAVLWDRYFRKYKSYFGWDTSEYGYPSVLEFEDVREENLMEDLRELNGILQTDKPDAKPTDCNKRKVESSSSWKKAKTSSAACLKELLKEYPLAEDFTVKRIMKLKDCSPNVEGELITDHLDHWIELANDPVYGPCFDVAKEEHFQNFSLLDVLSAIQDSKESNEAPPATVEAAKQQFETYCAVYMLAHDERMDVRKMLETPDTVKLAADYKGQIMEIYLARQKEQQKFLQMLKGLPRAEFLLYKLYTLQHRFPMELVGSAGSAALAGKDAVGDGSSPYDTGAKSATGQSQDKDVNKAIRECSEMRNAVTQFVNLSRFTEIKRCKGDKCWEIILDGKETAEENTYLSMGRESFHRETESQLSSSEIYYQFRKFPGFVFANRPYLTYQDQKIIAHEAKFSFQYQTEVQITKDWYQPHDTAVSYSKVYVNYDGVGPAVHVQQYLQSCEKDHRQTLHAIVARNNHIDELAAVTGTDTDNMLRNVYWTRPKGMGISEMLVDLGCILDGTDKEKIEKQQYEEVTAEVKQLDPYNLCTKDSQGKSLGTTPICASFMGAASLRCDPNMSTLRKQNGDHTAIPLGVKHSEKLPHPLREKPMPCSNREGDVAPSNCRYNHCLLIQNLEKHFPNGSPFKLKRVKFHDSYYNKTDEELGDMENPEVAEFYRMFRETNPRDDVTQMTTLKDVYEVPVCDSEADARKVASAMADCFMMNVVQRFHGNTPLGFAYVPHKAAVKADDEMATQYTLPPRREANVYSHYVLHIIEKSTSITPSTFVSDQHETMTPRAFTDPKHGAANFDLFLQNVSELNPPKEGQLGAAKLEELYFKCFVQDPVDGKYKISKLDPVDKKWKMMNGEVTRATIVNCQKRILHNCIINGKEAKLKFVASQLTADTESTFPNIFGDVTIESVHAAWGGMFGAGRFASETNNTNKLDRQLEQLFLDTDRARRRQATEDPLFLALQGYARIEDAEDGSACYCNIRTGAPYTIKDTEHEACKAGTGTAQAHTTRSIAKNRAQTKICSHPVPGTDRQRIFLKETVKFLKLVRAALGAVPKSQVVGTYPQHMHYSRPTWNPDPLTNIPPKFDEEWYTWDGEQV